MSSTVDMGALGNGLDLLDLKTPLLKQNNKKMLSPFAGETQKQQKNKKEKVGGD